MKSPRTMVVALCALAFAVSPAHALAQSGAGDDQYQDPLAGQNGAGPDTGGGADPGSGSSDSGSGDTGSSGGDPSADAGLSTAPPDSSLTTPPPIDSPTGTATSSQATLPNTGVDTRLLVGAGIALLLMGIGLRLRTADERRY